MTLHVRKPFPQDAPTFLLSITRRENKSKEDIKIKKKTATLGYTPSEDYCPENRCLRIYPQLNTIFRFITNCIARRTWFSPNHNNRRLLFCEYSLSMY